MSRSVVLVVVWFGLTHLATPLLGQQPRFSVTNSRSDHVHWIELYDAHNRRIDPHDPDAPPYSPVTTCGRCHDHRAISGGHHFNATLSEAAAGRASEPWVWTDERTGTQIPLSYRGWEGTYLPEDLGISDWEFVLRFGRHMPGGGPGTRMDTPSATDDAEQDDTADDAEDADLEPGRWHLSGPLNIDCLFCHKREGGYSPEIWWDQIQDENFAWAPTAAAGLADVEGRVAALPDDFDPATAEPDGRQQLPRTTYQNLQVSADNRVLIDIVGTPSDDACYYCHTSHPVGEQVGPLWTMDQDVHSHAGMSCADCHRHGIGHHMVRGYEGELNPSGEPVESLSCRGCHSGEADLGGRFAAPRAMHRGIPALHFDIMSCTSCHSGPPPVEEAGQMHTALAHGLGLESLDYLPELAPGIVAPVMKQVDGVLYPHRVLWPAFWGWMAGDEIMPLNPEAVHDALRRVLRVRRGQTLMGTLTDVRLTPDERTQLLGEERAQAPEDELTEDELDALDELLASKALEEWREKLVEALETLEELAPEDSQPIFVSGGKVYRRQDDGAVASFSHPAAEPYAWKMGHDVRPAMWSTGVRGCADCHSFDAPIFDGQVTAISTVPDEEPVRATMRQIAGYDPWMHEAWNLSFPGRPLFKYGGFAAMAVVGLVLLAYAMAGLQGVAGILRRW